MPGIVNLSPRPKISNSAYFPVLIAQVGPLVNNCRANGLDAAELRPDAQNKHHEEERNGPEVLQRHQQDGLWVRDERQSGAGLDHIGHIDVQVVRHKTGY